MPKCHAAQNFIYGTVHCAAAVAVGQNISYEQLATPLVPHKFPLKRLHSLHATSYYF